jgi:uncharacterized protein
MSAPRPASPPEGAPGQRLDSWKEIAAYLRRDVATARRWEKREGLPVHRHHHEKLGSVYAFTSELDAWSRGRREQLDRRSGQHFGRRPAVLIGVVAILGLLMAALYQFRGTGRAPAGRMRVRVAMHRPGTVASLIAAGLFDVLTGALSGVDVELVEVPGMMSTLRALDSGQVDVGLAFNLLAFHAVNTDAILGHPSKAITALTLAYATPAQIVVRRDSDLKTIADLRGRRVSLGVAESGERFCSQVLLSHFGLGLADISDHDLDFGASLKQVREKDLDAYITWRGLPVPEFAESFATGELRLIPIDVESLDGFRVKQPFLVPWTVPARVYPHQESSLPTVSARIMLVAARALPPGLVEDMLRVIAAHKPELIARHPAASDINVTEKPTFDAGLTIDLHPGAERFFAAAASDRSTGRR